MSFLNDLASEMVYPLVPALVTRVLGGGAVTLGLFDGIAEAVSAGSKLASGWIADRRAWRRPLVITGYAVASVARPAIGGLLSDRAGAARAMIGGWAIYAVACGGLAAAASSGAAVAWFLMFGLVAAATEAAERAFVAARGGTFRRGRAFGAYHAGVGMSALPGGLLFGLLYSQLGGSVALIASAAGAAALCVVGARSVE